MCDGCCGHCPVPPFVVVVGGKWTSLLVRFRRDGYDFTDCGCGDGEPPDSSLLGGAIVAKGRNETDPEHNAFMMEETTAQSFQVKMELMKTTMKATLRIRRSPCLLVPLWNGVS